MGARGGDLKASGGAEGGRAQAAAAEWGPCPPCSPAGAPQGPPHHGDPLRCPPAAESRRPAPPCASSRTGPCGAQHLGDPPVPAADVHHRGLRGGAAAGQGQVRERLPGAGAHVPLRGGPQGALQVPDREGGRGAPAAQGDRDPGPPAAPQRAAPLQLLPRPQARLPHPGVRAPRGALQGAAALPPPRRAPQRHADGGAGGRAAVLPRQEGDPPRHQTRKPAAGAEGRAQNRRFRLVGARPLPQEEDDVRDAGLPPPRDGGGADARREGGPVVPGGAVLRAAGRAPPLRERLPHRDLPPHHQGGPALPPQRPRGRPGPHLPPAAPRPRRAPAPAPGPAAPMGARPLPTGAAPRLRPPLKAGTP